MITRCKFTCIEKKERTGGCWDVAFYPVTSGSDENRSFYKYTPAGRLEFSTINKASADMFIVGTDYYIDISQSIV